MIGEGPFKDAVEGKYPGRIIKQEVVSYILEENRVVKHTATRLPLKGGDYYDSTAAEPLASWKNE